jgi:two-component system sensor histidine kinase PilS (NtrC family)
MVQHNAQRLARIVDDVLDVSRARQQRMLPLGEQLVLDGTVRHAAEEWVRKASARACWLAARTASCRCASTPNTCGAFW